MFISAVLLSIFNFSFIFTLTHFIWTLSDLPSCFVVTQDAEESGLPDNEDNSLQEHNETCTQDTKDTAGTEEDADSKVYLDLIPVRSFLHTSSTSKSLTAKDTSRLSPVPAEDQKDPSSQMKEVCMKDTLK